MSASWRTLARLAWRESRTARRRLLLYMSSIAFGVAALVAIDSFAQDVTRSVHEQSRSLLGGDILVTARNQFTPASDSLLRPIVRTPGVDSARITTFGAMAYAKRTGRTRLSQVRAITDRYPFYGEITTEPAGAWRRLTTERVAIVDPGLLVALDARVGDTLSLGYGRFVIAASITNIPGDPGIAAAIGPRIYIPARYIGETQLLVFGSRAQYEMVFKTPAGIDADNLVKDIRKPLSNAGVELRTVRERERDLTQAIGQLSDFLAVVGLIALLLGGIGVASGVHAFVTRKIDTVAVLRCLGATSKQVLAIYLSQAAAMGILGAAAGAVLGVGVQLMLPRVIGDFLPVDVHVHLEPLPILAGLAVGAWVAIIFALRPLLALRKVPPLAAIRRDLDDRALKLSRREPASWVVLLALLASVVGIAVVRVGSWKRGLIVSAGIGGAIGALWIAAWALGLIARRLGRAKLPYLVRQGLANLHRPANQTRAVMLALGFGAFLVATLYQVHSSLMHQFAISEASSPGNLVFFDVQDDQVAPLDSLIRARGDRIIDRTPIVNAKIAMINGRTVSVLQNDTLHRRATWALRREYRSTYRDTMTTSETLVKGHWFPKTPAAAGALPQVSVDADIAKDLRVNVGDTITWDVQGAEVPTVVTSFRDVEWARFEPNFFVVFQPVAVQDAPRQWVFVLNVPTDTGVARLQRTVVERWPNAASFDLSLVRRTVSGIVSKVAIAVRFLALLSVGMAIPVLFSAVAATRRARLREGVLLKTLGATRRQIARILAAEYLALGLLGALVGALLSTIAAWAMAKWMFQVPFQPAPLATSVIALVAMLTSVTIGVWTGREVFRETPMAALREQ